MRALVIGRGSMGKRRIRDLTALGVEVESWDQTDGVDTPWPWIAADVIVVSTPPLTHAKYANMAAGLSLPVFTEADVDSYRVKPSVRFPSATPLFTDWYADLDRIVAMKDLGSIAAYTLHVGQHLADWHPGADLRTYYAAQKETGACREMVPFELIWLTKLFGPVSDASGRIRRTGSIAAEADDVYQVLIRHQSGTLGHILIDTLSRPKVRRITLVGTRYQDSMDLTYSEETYLREMRAVVAALKGEKPWPYSQAEETANLEVLRMIERSD